jgi:hypothetical protein
MNHSIGFLISLVVLLAQNSSARNNHPSQTLLPTGVRLDPAGRSYDVGNMPMAMTLSPGSDYLERQFTAAGAEIAEETQRVNQTLSSLSAFAQRSPRLRR